MERTATVLVASNLFLILLAVVLQYDFATLIWTYWGESLVIGFFVVVGWLYDAWGKGLSESTRKTLHAVLSALVLSGIFLVFYGGFHLMYLFALLSFPFTALTPFAVQAVLLNCGLLVLSHSFSFYQNRVISGESWKVDPKIITKRISPLHSIIVLSAVVAQYSPPGAANAWLVVLFMGVKTLLDFRAHNEKHSDAQKNSV